MPTQPPTSMGGAKALGPVAIIERGCTPQQRVTTGTLGTIVEMAHTTGVGNPAVIVIGDVVRLSPDYRGD